MLRQKSALSLLFICLSLLTKAGGIKGKVFDQISNAPLIDATVTIKGLAYKTRTGLNGSYELRNIPGGTYTVVVTYVGYANREEQADVYGTEVKKLDISLTEASFSMQEVVVATSTTRETDRSTRLSEKNAGNIINVMSAQAIQISPDITVANILQRISGVTIERSASGEGRYAIIRGMDQRYNNTLVNGIKIPSPDDKYRYVPMDIFPSDLLESLEINKTLTPAMEADAIGGTMNMVMKNAPNRWQLQVNVAGGYNTLFSGRDFAKFDHSVISKRSPGEIYGPAYQATGKDFTKANLEFTAKAHPVNNTLGFSVGNRFLQKKLGVVLAASYQDIYRGSNSDFFHPNAQPDPGNVPVFDDVFIRQYSTENKRIGIHNKIDYVINPKNKISLYNLYLHMDELQSRNMVDSSFAIQRTGPGSGNVAILNRSRWQIQSIYSSTLRGDHTISDRFRFNWSGVYSIAKQNIPDWAEYQTNHSVTTDAGGKVTETPATLQDMTRRWLRNSDKDLAGYLNFFYSPVIADTHMEFSAGGLYRHKDRDNYYNIYDLSPVQDNGNAQLFTNIYDAQFGFKTADQGKSADANPNTYTSQENISAGYIQAKFMVIPKLQILGGVRVEHTDQKYATQMPETLDGKTGNISYTDVLPSVHLKYALTSQQNVRLSYYKGISRPGFFEIIPYNIAGEYYDEGGNPYVKHTTANNLDLRYEWFPGGADQILLGAFYKGIQNPIEYSIVRYGTGKQILKPNNFGNATNFGLEAVFTRYFGKFGFNANYTYTRSRITTDKNFYYRDNNNQLTTKTVQQTRPLQGQSDHIGNLSLLFKDGKSGFDIQLAFVYTGKRIAQVSPYYNLDYWQRAYQQLDFSLEKRIVKRFSFFAKVNNLTNTPRKVDILQPNTFISGSKMLPEQEDADRILVQKDIYKINFLAGLRFKM